MTSLKGVTVFCRCFNKDASNGGILKFLLNPEALNNFFGPFWAFDCLNYDHANQNWKLDQAVVTVCIHSTNNSLKFLMIEWKQTVRGDFRLIYKNDRKHRCDKFYSIILSSLYFSRFLSQYYKKVLTNRLLWLIF